MTKENEFLVARIKELEGIAALTEEETDTEKALVSSVELIACIWVLEQDVMDTLGYGFNTAVEQLRILNPWVEFVVKGAGPFNQVIDGKIYYPPEDSDGEDEDWLVLGSACPFLFYFGFVADVPNFVII